MIQGAHTFTSLFIITMLAFLVPLTLSRLPWLRVPIIVGELAAGALVGKSGLNWIDPTPALAFLSLFGLSYLMFLAGLEVDVDLLTAVPETPGPRPLPLALFMFGTTLIAAAVGAWSLIALGLQANPWFLLLVLSTTSVGVVVPVLKERRLLTGAFGQYVLSAALVADFATMLLLTLVVTLLDRGADPKLLLVLILLGLFLLLVRSVRQFQAGPWSRAVGKALEPFQHATAQIGVRGALALVVAFMALSEALGVENILGAFLAGVLISLLSVEEGSSLRHKLEAIGFGFFIPVFFISVGASLGLRQLLADRQGLLLLPLLLVFAFAIKVLPAGLLVPIFGWRHALSAGALLSARLSLLIAAATIGGQLGVLSNAAVAALILMAMLMTLLSPLLFQVLGAPANLGRSGRHILVVGGGVAARHATQRLVQAGERVIWLHPRGRRPALIPGAKRMLGNPTSVESLRRAGAASARSLLALDADEDVNLHCCHVALHEFDVRHRVARVVSDTAEERARLEGTVPYREDTAPGLLLLALARFPGALEWLTPAPGTETREIVLRQPGAMIRDLPLGGHSLVLALLRDGERIVPRGGTRLRGGDTLVVTGPSAELDRLEWELGPVP